MTAYKILITATITDEVIIEADTPQEAMSRAKAQFHCTGEPPQTFDVETAVADLLEPVRIRGYLPDEICEYHDMPKVHRGKCPKCWGAYGGND